MNSLEKIRDIKSLINEVYQGELSECARKSWLVFQQYCDDIKQDLELLEQLKQQRDSLAINNGELCVKVADLQKENQDLKEWNKKYLSELERWGYPETPIHISKYKKLTKAIEIIKKHISVEKQGNYMYFDYQDNDLTQQEYKLLKEVLE